MDSKVDKKKETKKVKKEIKNDNNKIYSILAYIGILWIIGFFVDDKNDATKFHVGQSMLITIVWIVVCFLSDLVSKIFVVTKYSYFGLKEYQTTSALGNFIIIALYLIPIALSIIGLMNAAKDKECKLPVIGKYAFYK